MRCWLAVLSAGRTRITAAVAVAIARRPRIRPARGWRPATVALLIAVLAGAGAALASATVPGPPTGVSANGGSKEGGQAKVSWTAPASNGGATIKKYTVTSSPGSHTCTTSSEPQTSCTVSGLTNGSSYAFKVTATNSQGTGLAGTSSSTTISGAPGPPSGVSATAEVGQAKVSWSAAPSNGSTVTKYTVTSSPGGQTCATSSGSERSCAVTGLTGGASYTFTVTATNANGTGTSSAASGSVTLPPVPGPPTGVTATDEPGAEALVSWTAPSSDGGEPITRYTVTASPGGQSCTTEVPEESEAEPETSCTVSGLTGASAYTFTVTATNANGTGPASVPSNSVTIAGVPGPPTGVTARNESAGEALVSWTIPASSGDSEINSYTVTASPGGQTCMTSQEGITNQGSESKGMCTVFGLTDGTAYTFTVTAANIQGTGPPSSPSNPTTIVGPPGAPSEVAAAQLNGQEVLVSWTAPASDGGATITKYTVTSSPGGNTCTTGSQSEKECTVTGLTNGGSYTFTVTATNASGTGPSSGASPEIQIYGVPGRPTGVTATGGSVPGGEAVVSWTIPPGSREVVSEAQGELYVYTVTASPGGQSCTLGRLWFEFERESSASCTVTGLTNGSAYTFKVTAKNSQGTGPASNPSSSTTISGAPGAPSSVAARAESGQVTVLWTAPESNGGKMITEYTVTSSPGSQTCTTSGESCTVTGLSNGTAYTFTVAATNDNGTGPVSGASSAVTPVGPSTTTQLEVLPAKRRVHHTIEYFAHLTPYEATGKVRFTDNGTTIAGCGEVTVSSGVASCEVEYPATGEQTIVAHFTNTAGEYEASSSEPETVVIEKQPSGVGISASNQHPKSGEQDSYEGNALEAETRSYAHPGTMTFRDEGVEISGCVKLPVNTEGAAVCETVAGAVGEHKITATFESEFYETEVSTEYPVWVEPPLPSIEGGEWIGASTTETTVILWGAVNPEGSEVLECEIEYGTSTPLQQSAPCASLPGSGDEPVEVTAEITGLEPATTYKFRIKAVNASGAAYGPYVEETTAPVSTTSTTTTTSPTTTITSPTTTTTASTTTTTTISPSTTTSSTTATTTISPTTTSPTTTTTSTTTTGSPTTTTSSATTTTSSSSTTTTEALKPIVDTGSSGEVTATSAVLLGEVDPRGSEVTSCVIEWGPTNSFGKSVPCAPAPGSGSSLVAVEGKIEGLEPETFYAYRVVATNGAGTETGEVEYVETLPASTTTTTTSPTSTTTSTTTTSPTTTTTSTSTTTTAPTTTTTTTSPTTTSTTSASSSTTTTTTSPTTTTSTTTPTTTTTSTTTPTTTTSTTTTSTVPERPTVSPGTATEVTSTSADLHAWVNANGSEVNLCEFEYGVAPNFTKSAPCSPAVGSGTNLVGVAFEAEGLTPGVEYVFRVRARNLGGYENGGSQTFDTPALTTTTTTTSSSSTSTTSSPTTTTSSTTTSPTTTSTTTTSPTTTTSSSSSTTTSSPTTTTTTSATTTSTTSTSSSMTTTMTPPTTTTTTTTSAGVTGIAGSVATIAQAKPCVSQRVERITWRVRPAVTLRRITVTVNGRTYRTLRGGARSLRVSLIGLPKETVLVKVAGVAISGRLYTHVFTFHTCAPSAGKRRDPGVPYFQ